MILKHLDLFSGIGGFALAASWAGFRTVGFSEINKYASKVLKKHWPNVPNYGDVRNIDKVDKLDLITGGFPCQPFSSAGKRKGRHDERHLWPEFMRIIRNSRPAWVVGENVAGIVNMELDNILADLEDEGYEAGAFLIPACAVNAPHRRERCWIVAHAMRERCDDGFDYFRQCEIQVIFERGIDQTKQLGGEIWPLSWKSFTTKTWLGFTTDPDRIPSRQTDTGTESVEDKRNARLGPTRQNRANKTDDEGEESQPPVCGVDDGIPFGMDRNTALGNAIVPQVAYPILQAIATIRRYELESRTVDK